MVSFTGSTAVGQRIGEVAGRDMKRLLLELGGKGAGIVFDDADLKTAIGTIASVWAFHSGQICTAPDAGDRPARRLRPGGRRAAAGRRPAQGRRSARAGHRASARSSPRPSATASRRSCRPGVEQGGELVAGGERPDMATRLLRRARRCSPAASPTTRAVQQEFFGPVVVVVPFDDEDEAVAIANGTEFGLYDYVFSADTARAMRVARQLRTGNVGINTAQRNHEAPVRRLQDVSGVGRDGGSFGLHAYSELQSIVWPG